MEEMQNPNASETAIVSSDGMWAIDAFSVISVNILEQNDTIYVIVEFNIGESTTIKADFEHCESIEDAEFKRAQILLDIERIVGHI